MTKYVLQSGGLRRNLEKAKGFFTEVLKDSGKKPKILLCFFAEKRENWEVKFQAFTVGFFDFIDSEIQPSFELAIPSKFEEQVKDSDIIYIYGGDDYLLQFWLKQFDLEKIFKDKVVATISAGSDQLTTAAWSCDWRSCVSGLGILPIKFIPHYKSVEFIQNDPRGPISWEKAYQELTDYGDNSLPIYALEEGDFVVFEK